MILLFLKSFKILKSYID